MDHQEETAAVAPNGSADPEPAKPRPVEIVVTPEPRDPHKPPRSARFIARLGDEGRVLGTFTAPLCGGARVLLAEGVPPETPVQMRHAGSATIALRSTVGRAASLTVNEETGDGKPRFAKWRPIDRSRLLKAAE